MEMEEEAIRAWRELFAVTARNIREAVAAVVKEGAQTLTEEFYERLQQNPRTTGFMEQERVQRRLRASLRRWMVELFAVSEDGEIVEAIRRQIEVGIVHARVRVPIDLIPAGIRVLKRGIRRRIDFTPLNQNERMIALAYVSDLLHLADSLMNQAYLRDAQDVVRNDEGYRLIAQKRSAAIERARQRAALSEWAEGLFMALWGNRRMPALTRLRDSEFGVWMHHKGAAMFEHDDDFRAVIDAIDNMDDNLLPCLLDESAERADAERHIATIKTVLDMIRHHVNELFERAGSNDDGLDEETRLPGRRYLAAILGREMRAHKDSRRPFCLILIRVEFPALEGAAGAGTRSRLLQAAVNVVVDSARTTDHLFRYDEQHFLLVAVETPRARAGELATGIAEKLKRALHAGNVQGSWTPVNAGVSIGIAEYDQHPDYQYFIQRTEAALAEALQGNRSRVAVG